MNPIVKMLDCEQDSHEPSESEFFDHLYVLAEFVKQSVDDKSEDVAFWQVVFQKHI